MYLNLKGEGGQVVLMYVDEAALPLHRIVVSLLCILPIIEEDMSSLVRTQCSRSESQPGDEWGHLGHLGPIKIEVDDNKCFSSNNYNDQLGEAAVGHLN